MMLRFTLTIVLNIISMSMVLADWPSCETYKEDLKGMIITDAAAILVIVDEEVVALTKSFEDKLNALHVSYLKAKEFDTAHPNESTGDKGKWQKLKHKLESDKTDDLKRIKTRISKAHDIVTNLCNDAEYVENRSHVEYTLDFCDDTTTGLWKIIGEVDQRVKKQLADNGLTVSNRIDVEVNVSVPKDLDMVIVQAVFEAKGKGGGLEELELYKSEASKITTDIMHKERVRLQAKLKTLEEHFAPRVEKAKQIPSLMANIVFQKFRQELEQSQARGNNVIARRLGRHPFGGPRSECKEMDKIDGILDCAKISTELVKQILGNHVQHVLDYAAIVNYELELVHH